MIRASIYDDVQLLEFRVNETLDGSYIQFLTNAKIN
jgi:hypothetical protein